MTSQALAVRDDMPLQELGNILAKSGFFADTREAGQAIVKVLAGRELGFGPIASMTGVYIVKGRVCLSANLMAAAVKRTGKYNYRITEHTDKACEIAFHEGGVEVGRSKFTTDDARKAGTQNMDKFPRNMLFARAMSNGVKWYCPDVFAGPVYTPEEMGQATDEEGAVIENAPPRPTNGNGHTSARLVEVAPPPPQAPPEAEPAAETPGDADPDPAEEVKFVPAMMKVRKATSDWARACKELAVKFPKYQTVLRSGELSGQANYHHVLGAAAKCGFVEVNDDNYQIVVEAIAARAAAEAVPA